MTDERSSKRAKVENESVDANEALGLVLVSRGEELNFKPEMCHQLFGEDEVISGHVEPSARVSIDHSSFRYAVTFNSRQKSSGATEVEAILASNFKEGLRKGHEKASSEPSLALPTISSLGAPVLTREAAGELTLYIHHCNLSQANANVQAIHARAQQLLPLFIDGATPIDQSEPEWDLYLATQELEDKSTLLLGFCTVYRIYAYPNSSRFRVSQLFVLPPCQKQGIGRLLLEAVYKVADDTDGADIIYEEPTDDVQVLREKIELQRCHLSPWLVDLAAEEGKTSLALNGHAVDQMPASLALRAEQVALAQKEMRIPKQQVRRLWEILLMKQKAFQTEPGQYPLRGLVARRLFGKFSDTEQQAVGKQIFTGSDGISFSMHKVPKSEGLKGAPVALEEMKEEGQSKEEREAALDKAVEQRMEFLSRLAGLAA